MKKNPKVLDDNRITLKVGTEVKMGDGATGKVCATEKVSTTGRASAAGTSSATGATSAAGTPSTLDLTEKDHPRKKLSKISILVIALFFLFWCSLLFLFPYSEWTFSPALIFETVQRRFTQLYLFLYGDEQVFAISFYQQIAVAVVGASLAATGAIFQGSFKNILAGPSTMGVMSGGTLGFMVYLLFFAETKVHTSFATADLEAYNSRSFLEIYISQICILAGCFFAVALVVTISMIAGRGRLSPWAMILSGTVFSAFVSNISMLIQYYMIAEDPTDPRIEAIEDMNMGNFNSITTWRDLLLLAVPLFVCLGILIALRGKLNLLSMDDALALSTGVNVQLYRILMVAAGTIMTAMVVAFCGHIGFLGFMVPIVARKIAGPDMKSLLPTSILTGAILLTVVYDVAYVVGLTDYLNLFTSSIGAAFMAYTLIATKRKGRDWS